MYTPSRHIRQSCTAVLEADYEWGGLATLMTIMICSWNGRRLRMCRTPLLVIQGAKDPRVVKAESDQMVEKKRAQVGKYHPVDGYGGSLFRRTIIRFAPFILKLFAENRV